MRIPGASRVVILSVSVVLAVAGCSGGSSAGDSGPGAPVVGTVGVAPGTATAPGGTATVEEPAPGDTTDPADPDATATDDAPTPGPAQGGSVDPDDPQGAAQAYGVTLVDPQAEGMVSNGFVGFRSPSGRIVCGVSDEDGGAPADARCDVVDNTWTPPARPADCELDWGSSVAVSAGRGRATFACVGDVASDGNGVLGYGKGVLVGPILCMSRTTGVECVVTSGPKHGFKVAKAAYTLY